jgi:hypothetical protein
MKPNTEIKAEVLRERSNCGVAEYEVVLNRATAANDGKHPTSKQIIAALDEWRSQFGATTSPIGGTYATEETWKKIHADSERAAREELLSSSAELRTLTTLEQEAIELQRRAREQEAKLNNWFTEWTGLPARAASFREQLGAVAQQRETLGDALDAEFAEAYAALVRGNVQFTAKVNQLAATIVTRQLRLTILKGIEDEANAEIQKLDARNKELSKLLGRPKLEL